MKKFTGGLALVTALGAALTYGFFAHRQHWVPYYQVKGLFRVLRPQHLARRWNRPAEGGSALAEREAIGALVQLPYLRGYNPASGKGGVTLYDAARAYPGLNLCLSAHAPEARLMDMEGAVRHRWALEAGRIWPGLKLDSERREDDLYWRRALLLPGGDLLVVWEYIGLMRIDSQSRLKWAVRCGANHDVAVDRDGMIYVPTHEKKVLPEVNAAEPIFEDFVTVLTPDGHIVRNISLLQAFVNSDYAPVLVNMKNEGDLFHSNSIQVLDGALASRSPVFRAGNLLVSIHSLSVLAILDPRQDRIVWALSGQWRAQHSPRSLASGRMLLFDNFGSMHMGESRALEVDPFTQEILWRYGEGKDERMFSETNGFVQGLPNGNVLVVVSNEGRALEITPGREVVWRYDSPFRTGEKNELVATLHQVERLPADLPVDSWSQPPPR